MRHFTHRFIHFRQTGYTVAPSLTWQRSSEHSHTPVPHTTQGMAAQQQQQQLEGIHKYKIAPPRFTGEYNTFEEWKYKMTAYLGLRDASCSRLPRQSEQSQLSVTNGQLQTAAPSQAVAEQWIQLLQQLTLHLFEHMRWTSVNNLQTEHARQRMESIICPGLGGAERRPFAQCLFSPLLKQGPTSGLGRQLVVKVRQATLRLARLGIGGTNGGGAALFC